MVEIKNSRDIQKLLYQKVPQLIEKLDKCIKIVGTAIVEILTLFGILNNPTDGENF